MKKIVFIFAILYSANSMGIVIKFNNEHKEIREIIQTLNNSIEETIITSVHQFTQKAEEANLQLNMNDLRRLIFEMQVFIKEVGQETIVNLIEESNEVAIPQNLQQTIKAIQNEIIKPAMEKAQKTITKAFVQLKNNPQGSITQ